MKEREASKGPPLLGERATTQGRPYGNFIPE